MKLKNTLKYNRALGIVVLVLIIPLTLILKANLSLSAKKGDLKEAYAEGMKTGVQSCADSMTLFCAAAEKAGIDVSETRAAVAGFNDAAKDVFSVTEAAEKVFPLLKQSHDLLKTTPGADTVLADRYYNAIGSSLKQLADQTEYAGERSDYEFVRTHPIAGKITLPASEATDFAALFERYGSDFDLTVTPPEPEFVSWLGAIFGAVADIVSDVLGWILHAAWWILSRGKGIVGVLIVIGLISAASGSRSRK